MSNQKITLTVDARDNASRVIDGIKKKLDGSLTGSIFKANALGSALSSAFAVAGRAADGFFDHFKKGMNAQSQMLMAAQGVMSTTGLSLQKSEEFIGGIVSEMSKSALALPGEADAYISNALSMTDDILAAYTDAVTGSVDYKGAQNAINKLAEGASLLQSTNSEISSRDVNRAISTAFGGNSLKELTQLDLFVKNPAARNSLLKQAEAANKEWADLTGKERAEMLTKAFEVSPEIRQRFAKTLETQWSSFTSSLFGTYSGIFGTLRELPSVFGGASNITEALDRAAVVIFGEYGLLSSLADTFEKMGFTGDPGVAIRDGIVRFTDFLRIRIIEPLRSANKTLAGIPPISKWTEWISGTINRILGNVSQVDSEGAGKAAGEFIGKAIDLLGGVLRRIDYGALGQIVGNGLKGFFSAVGSILGSLDTQEIAGIAMAIMFRGGVLVAMSGFAAALGVAATPGGMLAIIAALLWGSIANTVAMHWPMIVDSVGAYFSNTASMIKNSFGLLVGLVTGNWELVMSSANGLKDSLITGFNQLRDLVANIVSAVPGLNMATSGQAAANQSAANAEAKYQSALSSVNPNQPLTAVGSRAAGQPDLLGGLLNAGRRELSASPSGSNLVVANSSEAILNRQQQRELMAASGRGGGSPQFIMNLSVNSNADIKQIKEQVFREFAQGWRDFQNNQLAPGF